MRFEIGMKFRNNNNDSFTQCELGLVHCTLLSIIKILMNYYGRKKCISHHIWNAFRFSYINFASKDCLFVVLLHSVYDIDIEFIHQTPNHCHLLAH